MLKTYKKCKLRAKSGLDSMILITDINKNGETWQAVGHKLANHLCQ